MKYFLMFFLLLVVAGCENNPEINKSIKKKNPPNSNKPQKELLIDLSNKETKEGWVPYPKNIKPHLFKHLDGSGDLVENKTHLYLFTYKSHFGIYAICFDKDMEHLIYNHTAKDDHVWKDDNLEICLTSENNENPKKFNFSINPVGSFYDANSVKRKKWNSSSKYLTKIFDDRWEIQILIPFKDIEVKSHNQNIFTNIFRVTNGRTNQVAEDTGWASTNSLRGNVLKYFKKLSISKDAFNHQFEKEKMATYPQDKNFENKILNYLKNSSRNEAYIVKEKPANKVVLDGNLTEPCWKNISKAYLKANDLRENSNMQQTTFKVFTKDNTLYIGIECLEKAMNQLTLLAKGPSNLWQDDSIELYLMPEMKATREYLQLVVNPKNMISIQNGKGSKREVLPDLVKALKAHIKTATKIDKHKWTIEIAIPLKAFDSINKSDSKNWAFNITRYRPQKPGQPMQSMSWSKLNCYESHLPGKFGSLWLFGNSKIKQSLFALINKEKTTISFTKKLSLAPHSILNQNWDFLTNIIEPKSLKKMFYNELREIQIKQIQKRDQRWSKVKDKKSLISFQKKNRANFIKTLGGFPKIKSPLNAIETKIFTCKEYELYTIRFESLPNHYVTGNLYKPLNKKNKMPTIIRIIGHSTAGKRSRSTVQFSDHLARHGYTVLVLDSVGQGERIYVNQGIGSRTPTSNHYSMGAPMNLIGEGLAKIFVWDVIRGVDFILGKSYVDPERLILTGSSGGGTVSSYAGAIDTRIKGIASVSAMTSGDLSGGNADAEQNLFNQLNNGCDAFGRIILMAPRPYTIITEVTSKKYKALNNKMISTVTKSWSIHGKNKLEYFPTSFPHGYGSKHRHLFYLWLQKYFPTQNPNITKEEKPYFSDLDKLYVTKTWRVYFDRELKKVRPLFIQNKEKATTYKKDYLDFSKSQNQIKLRDKLAKLLKVDITKIKPKKIKTFKTKENGNLTISQKYLQSTKNITIPFLHIYSKKSVQPKDIIILINQRGKDLTLKSRYQQILKLADNNYHIIIPDLGGIGETAVDNDVYYLSDEVTKAALSFQLGTSIYQFRIENTLTLIASVKKIYKNTKIHLLGDSLSKQNPAIIRQNRLMIDKGQEELHVAESIGPMTVMLTAVFSQDISSCVLLSPITNFKDIFESHYFYHMMSIFPHGILKFMDTTEIHSLIAPANLLIINPVNGRNQLIDKSQLKTSPKLIKLFASKKSKIEFKFNGFNDILEFFNQKK